MRALLLTASIALASCGTPVLEDTTRDVARSVIKPIVAARFPGVPTDFVVDCIIDNASGAEVIQIAASAATGSQAGAVETVTSIATRPETVTCITQNGLQGLLGG